jgi:hypothetical protein
MKTLLAIVVFCGLLFCTGFAVSRPIENATYNPFYYCAARSNTCSEPGFFYVDSFLGTCCCDLDQDQVWHYCYAIVEVYQRNGERCYRLASSWIEDNEICIPGPVATHPYEPADWQTCCSVPEVSESSAVRSSTLEVHKR